MESLSAAATAGRGMGITLSLGRKKILNTALKDGNRAGAELLLHEIFSSMEDQGALLSVARDISDLLISFIEEKGLRFPLDGRLVLEWLKEKKPVEAEEKFNELFRQVINLTRENREFSVHIRQARDYILTHYASDMSLEKTAAELYISPAYLSRLYKKETGISFVDDLNRVRVDAARVCLLDGMNLKKTAALCGFRYYNYFIKVFKDYTGLTPADFPRRN
jgi:YesN/AraC family two-component response regulator